MIRIFFSQEDAAWACSLPNDDAVYYGVSPTQALHEAFQGLAEKSLRATAAGTLDDLADDIDGEVYR